jgi:hypothetical protein
MRKPSPAMIVALVGVFLGLGGVGIAANGQGLILGSPSNAATAQTALTATTSSAALAVTNSGGGIPLKLTAPAGKPPLVINSPTKVMSLNADLLDSHDSTYFLPATAKAANADKLDGINSTGFVQGRGSTQFIHKTLDVGHSVANFLALPGIGAFNVSCLQGGTANADLAWTDPVGVEGSVVTWVNNATATQPVTSGTTEFTSGYGFSPIVTMWQLWKKDGTALATVWFTQSNDNTHCFYSASALVQSA